MRRQQQISVLKLTQRIVDELESGRADEVHMTEKHVESVAAMWLPPVLRRRRTNDRLRRVDRRPSASAEE